MSRGPGRITHVYDVQELSAHFPSLAGGTAYFDGPGGTQTPDVVGEAMRHTLTQPLSNRGRLTPAERNILRLVAAEKTTRQIADELRISPRTVDRHRANICEKIDLHGSFALIKFALAHKSELL